MDTGLDFLIKISITFVLSIIIFAGLLKYQIKKELIARRRFNDYLKNRGLDSGEDK